ncbi:MULTISPECIES: hypothetical protein [Bradyrhizobium]|nr:MULTISPECIES: hypothetical protein [Bradyrhizobium]MDU2927320.1 hypothetical protein [Bradyrhizobium sp.]MDU3128374.1 hypothetical protein [Bradyrhizobium sp.]MDU6137262.1 hypothetical protein [Bradyrhizobium sp.]MDU6322824.1 hypothetical protein [Bradyrhizobium sp.]MDU6399590.1 hypothetical protein [Bradyrhizobium sp.]
MLRVLPGAPGFLVTVRDSTLIARRRGGIGFGMLRTARLGRTP